MVDYLISICVSVHREKPEFLVRCFDSIKKQTYRNYELIIVCDDVRDNKLLEIVNSMDGAKVYKHDHSGVAYSRNVFLKNCSGDICTYLDSDNYWDNQYLNIVNRVFNIPNVSNCYMALKKIHSGEILFKKFDYGELIKDNYIDMNVYAHSRKLYEELGGFDEKLSRLVDWDLILKYTHNHRPRMIEYIGVYYEDDVKIDTRISIKNPIIYNRYRIFKKYLQLGKRYLGKKILYVVFHYDQLSESYIDWEMRYFEELGAEIQVMATTDIIPSPIKHNKKIYYDLDEAIQTFKPDHIHIHWLNIFCDVIDIIEKYNIPTTLRIHGFDIVSENMERTKSVKQLKKILIYPAYMINTDYTNLVVSRVPINPEIHYPPPVIRLKNKRGVLRVGAGLPTKDLPTYIKLANDPELQDFTFTFFIIRCTYKEFMIDEVIELNNQLGGRCKIVVNASREETAEEMRKSFIYLHTTDVDVMYGQPISIAEAMATGNYIIARKFYEATSEYIQNAGVTYDTYDEAKAELLKTLEWSEDRWYNAYRTSIDYVYSKYIPEKCVVDILK